MADSNAWLAPIAIALITALATYLALLRKTSGRISTTEADKLWDEAADLREVYRAEIAELREEIERLEKEVEKCEQAFRELKRENDALHRENALLLKRVEDIENHASI